MHEVPEVPALCLGPIRMISTCFANCREQESSCHVTHPPISQFDALAKQSFMKSTSSLANFLAIQPIFHPFDPYYTSTVQSSEVHTSELGYLPKGN
jgi:hypothetical protein